VRALVLAAGAATRLRPLTARTPKCLLDIGGKSILARLLDTLAGQGISEAYLVTGYCAGKIRAFAAGLDGQSPLRVTVVENPRYRETNNITSVWVARPVLTGSAFLICYADILFHPAILQGCLEAPGEICLAVSREIHPESKKVATRGSHVLAVGKGIPAAEVTGTFLGIARFSPDGGRLLFAEVEVLLHEGATGEYYTAAVARVIAKGVTVHCAVASGLPWIDIDGPEELARARETILPQIGATLGSR
jgi:choline kinase